MSSAINELSLEMLRSIREAFILDKFLNDLPICTIDQDYP